MKVLSGHLTLLGDHLVTPQVREYSVIRVDKTILSKVVVPAGLNSFLTEAMGDQVTLHYVKPLGILGRHILVGLESSGGRYYVKENALRIFILLIGGIALIPLLGFGLLFLPQAFVGLAFNGAASELQSRGFQLVR
ncbi:hypothetical protein AZA_20980 [Nitrospirillum viridazoti Y2]|uniref:Uncharacterized protein n=1 Tax=Nitrospirillum amazonense TaxID=28077 RepID=A0A560IZI5_9PROT|nr:hypothetical protein [Nitrospirillum amazonense]EGY02045.1 hypothetical protein AZA_20980 [Nitrospirillum amazonense Y2]TWB64237.1 hypothetical protein FBZ92_101130 [Nitrospirillum amazonense]